MKLLLDIGNTRIKSAVLHDGVLSQHHVLAHAGLSATQLQSQLLQRYGSIDAAIISNVAGADIVNRLGQGIQHLWQIAPTLAVTAAVHGEVRNAYPDPHKLGVDRWLCLLAAHAMHTGAQVNLIVSIGTAMTLDALGADGQHRGGLIVPGPDLMINSLLHNTSDIAAHAAGGESVAEFFADNTLGAIQQGAARACAALIETSYRHLAIEESLKVLITGGAAARVMPLLGVPALEVPDLVLQGLAVLASS